MFQPPGIVVELRSTRWYTPKEGAEMSDTQKIQWDQPLEAVHEDGRVVSLHSPENHGNVYWDKAANSELGTFYIRSATGELCFTQHGDGWTIRNVAPSTPTRTALEQRMEDFVRSVANGGVNGGTQQQARAILAELEPVDLHVDAIAEALAAVDRVEWKNVKEGTSPYHEAGLYRNDYRAYAKAALSRGRALERGESPVTNEGAGR